VEKINTYITLAGPETVGNEYVNDFLDPKNHADGRAPVIMSHHAFLGMATGGVSGSTSGEVFFRAIDGFMTGNVAGIVKQRDLVASKTQLVLNEVRTMLLLLLLLLELVLLLVLLTLLLMLLILTSVLQWIPFLNDWCDPADAKRLFAKHSDLGKDPRWQGSATSGAACPNWQDPKSHGTKANRQTLGWNAAAAAFAYGYGRLGLVGYKYVGADQLIGGPWPDNEPAVSCLDWTTGQPNAKYWAITMLAKEMGTGNKSFFDANATAISSSSGSVSAPPPPMPSGCYTSPKGTTYKVRGLLRLLLRHIFLLVLLELTSSVLCSGARATCSPQSLTTAATSAQL